MDTQTCLEQIAAEMFGILGRQPKSLDKQKINFYELMSKCYQVAAWQRWGCPQAHIKANKDVTLLL